MLRSIFSTRTSLISFFICYLLMVISILSYYYLRSDICVYVANLFFYLTALIGIVFFILMLVKLFTEPKTHKLTSFSGLIIGEIFCIFWFYFVSRGFNTLNSGWDYVIAFLYVSIFAYLGRFVYGILFLVKILIWFVCSSLVQTDDAD
ncbi:MULTISPECIES: hypothetical protein [unclassified Gilliamella]|uniref:hypothetical protein n=1 Tax=unclassified Gilliamella TaxID=2685620 RepID=UPI001328FD06|nr:MULTISPECIES: hypothetical protein [unclassified Gilliamella]MWN31036.1 hypothetical protein [Gilliamella sp. Pra-s60]MWP28399.1 hypothetical protein [Gilliamella sp. Pra-s54]